LDINTEQESKALATLEDENQKNTLKRWKSESDSLAAFLGVKEIIDRQIWLHESSLLPISKF